MFLLLGVCRRSKFDEGKGKLKIEQHCSSHVWNDLMRCAVLSLICWILMLESKCLQHCMSYFHMDLVMHVVSLLILWSFDLGLKHI